MKKILMCVLVFLLATAPIITDMFDPQPDNNQYETMAPYYFDSDPQIITTN